MKRLLYIAAAASFGLLAASTAFADPSSIYIEGDRANGIAYSRHNLGAFSLQTSTTDTTEICVFCHTPHHTSGTNQPPLWNRANINASTGSPVTYTAYGTTLGGSNITSVGAVSQACLSCHDGVTALDTIRNAPGKGGVTPGGTVQGWAFWRRPSPFDPPIWIGPSPTMAQIEWRLNETTITGDDHPVSVVYQSDRASLRPKTTILGSIDLTTGLAASASTFDSNNLRQNKWSTPIGITQNAPIWMLLKNGYTTVECTSCHDPHFRNLTASSSSQGLPLARQSTDGLFLRRVGGNVASALCRTCHNK